VDYSRLIRGYDKMVCPSFFCYLAS
jgi:hypothetical protein